MTVNRRNFLRMLGMAGGLGQLSAINANAQSASDYRALVCIFLLGGNDSNNMVVPLSAEGYGQYAQSRGAVLNLSQQVLLPVTASNGAAYGLHPALAPLAQLYNQKKVAIVLNVGTLIEPLTKATFRSAGSQVPMNLYSHSDQQNQWQTAPAASTGRSGWGGRAVDVIQYLNGPSNFPSAVSTAGNSAFLLGQTTIPGTVNQALGLGLEGSDGSSEAVARDNAFQQILTFSSGMTLVQAANKTAADGIRIGKTLNETLAGISPLTTVFPNSGLGQQLAQVARIIRIRQVLGLNRQIFFCTQGGYDTHSDQLTQHQNLLTTMIQAVNSFYTATQELGVEDKVTTFLESEFNRTFQPNTGLGSDHAWGGHVFALGGAVKGDVYGKMPNLTLRGPDDVSDRGLWLPSIALDQYGATLASWFGVPDGSLTTVFPNLVNFPTRKLSFL
ncbi:MAG: DUF1501 domain-containing protein [Bryobacteraceae bacterium]|nr:DUF1501 domain-containing protein [Bryobacteraceae bacterium]